LHVLCRTQAAGDTAIAHQADRLVFPLLGEVVDRVHERRGHAVVVLRHHEDEGVGRIDTLAPLPRLRLGVFPQARVVRLGHQRQVDLLEIGHRHLEATMLPGDPLEPLANRQAGAALADARDDDHQSGLAALTSVESHGSTSLLSRSLTATLSPLSYGAISRPPSVW